MIGTQGSPDDDNIDELFDNVNNLLEDFADEDATTSTTSTTTKIPLPNVKGAKNYLLLFTNIYIYIYK